MLLRVGARASYLTGLAVFGVASLLCGMAPNMGVLIAGRALQGVAGGLLAGLGYAVINAALPRALWTRGAALVSAMWGVATVVGPATGGLFAQFGLWRWAFVAMAILAALMAMLVPIALRRAGRLEASARRRRSRCGRCCCWAPPRWRSALRSSRATPRRRRAARRRRGADRTVPFRRLGGCGQRCCRPAFLGPGR